MQNICFDTGQYASFPAPIDFLVWNTQAASYPHVILLALPKVFCSAQNLEQYQDLQLGFQLSVLSIYTLLISNCLRLSVLINSRPLIGLLEKVSGETSSLCRGISRIIQKIIPVHEEFYL